MRDVRRRLAGVTATRRGEREVILRFGDRTATLQDENGVWWQHFGDAEGRSRMPSIMDESRHNVFTAEVAGKTIAGYFDPELSRPD